MADTENMAEKGVKQKGELKTARIPIKIVPVDHAAEKAGLDTRQGRQQRRALRRNQDHAARDASCTPSARKPPAPTSANASAAARPPS
jgi:hypothetical protein